jgi:predicted acyltransferase
MLLIIGAGDFIYSLKDKTPYPWVNAIADQFEHTVWNGFTLYDFIFPLFLFIAGVSIPFSLNSGLSQGIPKTRLYQKAFRRMLILIVLGILEKNLPFPFFDLEHVRIGGVLQRIGFASFITTLLYLNFNLKSRLFWVIGILLLYYCCMFLIPVPGFGAGDLSFEGNLHGWIDRTILPGRLLQGTFDENGIFTQLPALCLTVMGSVAGDILRYKELSQYDRLKRLLLFGLSGIVIGLIWNFHFPINKRLWSSSFIALTSGMSFLFLALFYWMIDNLKISRWASPFVVIGMNSITAYLAYRFIDFNHTSKLLLEGLYINTPEPWHMVFEHLGALILVWLLMFFLYKKKIFVKI